MWPRVILATGPVASADAIVIDHRHLTIRRDGFGTLRLPQRHGKYPVTAFPLLAALLVRAPHVVTWNELVEHIYGGDPDGGPLDPIQVLRCIIARDRRKLEMLGIFVAVEHGRGPRLQLLANLQVAA